MKTENLDFSSQIRRSRLLNSPDPPTFKERLYVALDYLRANYQRGHSDSPGDDNLVVAYARGYLDIDLDFFWRAVSKGFPAFEEAARPKVALARSLLFLRMEAGKPVPYLYKEIDQDLTGTTPQVFNHGERDALKFSYAQLLEATLLARKFGIEHEEEGVRSFCEEVIQAHPADAQ